MKLNRFFVIILIFFIKNLFSETTRPISFQADRVEYIFKKGKEQTICKGKAKIWRDDFIINADLIKIYGSKNEFSEAYKNVKIVSIPDNVIITGDYAEYNNTNSYAKVFKNPVLYVTNEKLRIESAVMESYFDENIAVALGEVIITQTNYKAFCEKGVYYKDKNIIELSGNPVVYYDNDKFKSKKIIIYVKEKRVKLFGDIEAMVFSKKERKVEKTHSE